jgi:predicted AAA+ superfamily ATPase
MEGQSMAERIDDYADFLSCLFSLNGCFTDYIWDRISSDANIYIIKHAQKGTASPFLDRCLDRELRILEEISQLSAREIKNAIGYDGELPEWSNRPAGFFEDYKDLLGRVSQTGYGMFAKHRMFSVKNAELIPVKSPDPIMLSDLKGYERERKTVVDNTLALIEGKPAANTLLYGDAGTGKSSTVKAVVNEFRERGLRLIEIRKNQLSDIPAVIESLNGNPLKFILFIDDLSFSEYNDEIGTLKAMLEGAVLIKASNTVIYATSNRRHLVREKFSDRDGDDIHENETIQEQVSLSERFGLSVCFLKPDREQTCLSCGNYAVNTRFPILAGSKRAANGSHSSTAAARPGSRASLWNT